MDTPNDEEEILNESLKLDGTEDDAVNVADSIFDSPKSRSKAKRAKNYEVENLFWNVEVVENWTQKLKELDTPE